jgi:hypothetical protein
MATGTWPRGIAFAVLAAWIAFAPSYRQVFGGTDRHANRWTMYAGVALDLIEVRYRRDAPDGPAIDYYRTLGYADPAKAPERLRRITNLARARRIGFELCEQLGTGARVYLRAREATPDGFRVVAEGTGDLCADPARTPTGPGSLGAP